VRVGRRPTRHLRTVDFSLFINELITQCLAVFFDPFVVIAYTVIMHMHVYKTIHSRF